MAETQDEKLKQRGWMTRQEMAETNKDRSLKDESKYED